MMTLRSLDEEGWIDLSRTDTMDTELPPHQTRFERSFWSRRQNDHHRGHAIGVTLRAPFHVRRVGTVSAGSQLLHRPAVADLGQTDRVHFAAGRLLLGDAPAQIDLSPYHPAGLAVVTNGREDPLDQLITLFFHVPECRGHEDA
jgi:hypothetical protein